MQTENTTTSGDHRRKSAGKKSRSPRSASENSDLENAPLNAKEDIGEDSEGDVSPIIHESAIQDQQEKTVSPQPVTDFAASLQDEWASAPVQDTDASDANAKESRLVATGSRLIKEVDQWMDRKKVKGNAREAWHTIAETMRQRADQVDRNVKKKPYGYVLGALGVGVVIAKIIL